MKKTLAAAAMSSVLVLGLAGVSAAADATTTPAVAAGTSAITIDGSVRERGVYDKSNAAEDAAGASYYDSRVQLGVQAKVSKDATGYIQLESNYGNQDSYVWGQPVGGTQVGNTAGSLMDGGNKANSGLSILQAWINYQPGDFGVKVGHMPLALGNKVFFDHTLSGDDAIVVYGNLNGGATHVGALTIKFNEGATNVSSDDINGYVGLVTHKVNDSLNLGANWTYLHSTATSNLPAGTYLSAFPLGVAANAFTPYDVNLPGLSMSNVGLTADGKVGAISYMADLEMQFGTFMDNNAGFTSDANGWAAKVGGNYDLGAGKVGLLFGYGSGTKHDETDGDQHQFINFLGDTTYDTIIAGYRAAIPSNVDLGTGHFSGWGNGAGKNSGLANLTLYQLNGSTKTVCPLTGKDLALFASVSYMQLSEDIVSGTNADGSDHLVNKVGTEADLIATWALTSGLSYKVEAAYLWTGDAFESATLGVTTNPDDLLFLRHSLELKF